MILVLVDDQVVATGPDWMLHHFIADAAERFTDKNISIFTEAKE